MKARALPALIAALLLPVTQAHSEGLMEVYRKALSYDSELAAAKAARQAREAAVAESRAPLLPQLDAFGESSYTERNTLDGHITNHEYGLQLSQPLFRATVALITAIAQRRPDFYMARARSLFSDADHAILGDPGQIRRFRASQLACLHSGSRAIATDLLTEMGDWGFRLGDIRTPTLVHQGAEDQLLPPAYARHLARTLPDAELTMLPHSGHFYPLSRPFQGDLFQRIHESLSVPRGDR